MNVVPYFMKLKDKTFIKGHRDSDRRGVSGSLPARKAREDDVTCILQRSTCDVFMSIMYRQRGRLGPFSFPHIHGWWPR